MASYGGPTAARGYGASMTQQHPDPPPSAARPGLTVATAAEPGGAVRVIAAGSLDYDTVPAFNATVQDAFAAGAPALSIDLTGIRYCDSSGLAALVRAHKTARQAGCSFVIYSTHPGLNRMFVITGLDTVLPIDTTAPCDPPATL
jgi:anti-sigma B factor antagonist